MCDDAGAVSDRQGPRPRPRGRGGDNDSEERRQPLPRLDRQASRRPQRPRGPKKETSSLPRRVRANFCRQYYEVWAGLGCSACGISGSGISDGGGQAHAGSDGRDRAPGAPWSVSSACPRRAPATTDACSSIPAPAVARRRGVRDGLPRTVAHEVSAGYGVVRGSVTPACKPITLVNAVRACGAPLALCALTVTPCR